MKRSEKEAVIRRLADKAARAKALYLTDFTALTVAEETELRREFRKNGIDYTVVKNTLVRKALEQVSGFDSVYEQLAGPTSIAFGYDDVIAPARILKKFSAKTGKLKLKVAVIEREVFDGSRLDDLASLPSRQDLIAGILGSIQAPVAGIAGAIGALARDLVTVIDAIEKKKAA
jgi:large subunit ribosomal protein L10